MGATCKGATATRLLVTVLEALATSQTHSNMLQVNSEASTLHDPTSSTGHRLNRLEMPGHKPALEWAEQTGLETG